MKKKTKLFDKSLKNFELQMNGWTEVQHILSSDYRYNKTAVNVEHLLDLCGTRKLNYENRNCKDANKKKIETICDKFRLNKDILQLNQRDAIDYANNGYEQSKAKYAIALKRKTEWKKRAIIRMIGTVVIICIVGAVLYASPPMQYKIAQNYELEGNYQNAYNTYSQIEKLDFKDASDKAKVMKEKVERSKKYDFAMNMMKAGKYKEAYEYLKSVKNYGKTTDSKSEAVEQIYEDACSDIEKKRYLDGYTQLRLISGDMDVTADLENIRPNILKIVENFLITVSSSNEERLAELLWYLEPYARDEDASKLIDEINNTEITKLVVNEHTHYSYTMTKKFKDWSN